MAFHFLHLAVCPQLQPALGLGRRARHEHAIHVQGTSGPLVLPHCATARKPPALPTARRHNPPSPEHTSPLPLRTSWQGASSLNQPLDWDVAQVTNMRLMFNVRPGRCPIAPPHACLPHCLQPAASAPQARLSIPRLPLSTPGSMPPASTSLWTGTSRKSRTLEACSRYALRCPSALHRTRARSLPPCLQPAASAPHAR